MSDDELSVDSSAEVFRAAAGEIERLKTAVEGLDGLQQSFDQLTVALRGATDVAGTSAAALGAAAASVESGSQALARFDPERIVTELISVRERVVAEADRVRDGQEKAAGRIEASLEGNHQLISTLQTLVIAVIVILIVGIGAVLAVAFA